MMRERRRLPFPLVPFPVEVGSGFMADVELASEELGIPLLVPPPRRPQFGGCLGWGTPRSASRAGRESPSTATAAWPPCWTTPAPQTRRIFMGESS